MSTLEAIGIIVGVVAGVSGLVLSILNLIHARFTTRPQLRVRPRVIHVIDRAPHIGFDLTEKNVGVMEVANVGRVPVFGGTVGFLAPRKREKGLTVVSPPVLSGGPWPAEIQPGHLVMLRIKLDQLLDPAREGKLGRAFATTMIGDRFTASRADMRRFRADLKRIALSSTGEAAAERACD